jgi:hypothetical protein
MTKSEAMGINAVFDLMALSLHEMDREASAADDFSMKAYCRFRWMELDRIYREINVKPKYIYHPERWRGANAYHKAIHDADET